MAKRSTNSRRCSRLSGERRVTVKKMDTSFVLKGEFTFTFLKAKTSISAILQGLYWPVPNCQNLSALFHWDLKSYKASGKFIFITTPHRKATELASTQFWTLYKGKCLKSFEKCANPKWIEIYLKLLLCVKKPCAIYIYIYVFFISGMCI